MADNLQESRDLPFNVAGVAYRDSRIFYAVGSAIYYSRIEEAPIDRSRCFQRNDPTDFEFPDLLANDGGVLDIKGSSNITALVTFREGLLAASPEGCWYIQGGPDISTDAYRARKVTNYGIDYPESLVVVGSTGFYFNKGGIIAIEANEFDSVFGTNITDTTIKTYITENFTDNAANKITVEYSTDVNEIHWFNATSSDLLIFDIETRGFYPQKLTNPTGEELVRVVNEESDVLYKYLSFTDNGDKTGSLSWHELSDDTYLDYGTEPYEAYLETGPETLGQFALKKNIISIALAFNRTETQIIGFDNITNEYIYDYPSSCLLSQKADLSSYSRLQSRPRQVYRLNRRGWIPDSVTYPFSIADQGDDIVYFEDKVRGSGKISTIRMEAEEGKDLQLLGFAIDYTMKGRQR